MVVFEQKIHPQHTNPPQNSHLHSIFPSTFTDFSFFTPPPRLFQPPRLLERWGNRDLQLTETCYRVSHFEMDFMNWLWRIKICKLDLVWRWFWNAEIGNFWVQQLFFKKVTSAGLNSLRQKGYQISVKNCIFDNPFHEKGPVLVILVPGMI